MNLEQINTQTTWAEASNRINQNNAKINEAVIRLENSTYKNKGYFKTEEQLNGYIPNPSKGCLAYVASSTGGFDRYIEENGSWVNTHEKGGDPDVNLDLYYTKEEMNETINEIVSAFEQTINEINGRDLDIQQDLFDEMKESGLLDKTKNYYTY